MRPKTLTEHVKSHYEGRQLRPGAMRRLKALADGTGVSAEPLKAAGERRFWDAIFARPWPLVLATVSAILLAGYLLGVLTGGGPSHRRDLPLATALAREIALNHQKALKPDYRVDDFPAIGSLMAKLDFSPAEPSRLRQHPLALQGARYCSIQGYLAVQIRLADQRGGVYTLYQTLPHGPLAGLSNQSVEYGGLKIELWQEKGLLMGLVGG